MRSRTSLTITAVAMLAVGAVWFTTESRAWDHADAPGAAADPAADIASVYTWHTTSNTLVSVLTFSPMTPAGGTATYDADVLYTLNIDYDADNVADGTILVRFGQNAAGDWGVQGLFSSAAGSVTIEGEVETSLIDSASGIQLWAGLADDPFFFDLQGLNDTLASGTISFDSTRDGLAGLNVTAIVAETPLPFDGGSPVPNFSAWATTGRL